MNIMPFILKYRNYSGVVASMLPCFICVVAMVLLFSLNPAAALESLDAIQDTEALEAESMTLNESEGETDISFDAGEETREDLESETGDLSGTGKEIQEDGEAENDNPEELEPEYQPPMVYNHIFSPNPDQDQGAGGSAPDDGNMPGGPLKENDPVLERAKKDLVLTGIVITPASKRALIRFKGKQKSSGKSEFFEPGATFDDYVLKDVFSNYILVSCKDREMKLGLYRERGDRPAPPKVVEKNVSQSVKSDEKEQDDTDGQNKADADESDDVDEADDGASQDNPLVNALKRVGTKPVAPGGSRLSPRKKRTTGFVGNGVGNTDNPFLKAMQNARDRRE